MFEKKKKAAKNADLMKKAPAAGAVELGDDVLEAAAGGRVAHRVLRGSGVYCDHCGASVPLSVRRCPRCRTRFGLGLRRSCCGLVPSVMRVSRVVLRLLLLSPLVFFLWLLVFLLTKGMVLMFERKKKAKKNEDLMKKAPAAGAVELSDDALEAAAGGEVKWDASRGVWFDAGVRASYLDPASARAVADAAVESFYGHHAGSSGSRPSFFIFGSCLRRAPWSWVACAVAGGRGRSAPFVLRGLLPRRRLARLCWSTGSSEGLCCRCL